MIYVKVFLCKQNVAFKRIHPESIFLGFKFKLDICPRYITAPVLVTILLELGIRLSKLQTVIT